MRSLSRGCAGLEGPACWLLGSVTGRSGSSWAPPSSLSCSAASRMAFNRARRSAADSSMSSQCPEPCSAMPLQDSTVSDRSHPATKQRCCTNAVKNVSLNAVWAAEVSDGVKNTLDHDGPCRMMVLRPGSAQRLAFECGGSSLPPWVDCVALPVAQQHAPGTHTPAALQHHPGHAAHRSGSRPVMGRATPAPVWCRGTSRDAERET